MTFIFKSGIIGLSLFPSGMHFKEESPMTTTVLTNAELIENARTISAQDYHDELSKGIREAFAGLSFQESENAVNSCSAGKCYIIEIPVSDIFEEEYLYDINNTLRMSPLFKAVKRVLIFYKNGAKYVRIWLRGDVRKFLPRNHKLYHNEKTN